jgi:hypothetical protein
MTLAPLDLLTCVVAARPAALRGFQALAVDNGGAGAGLTTGSLAVRHDQRVVHPLEDAFVAQPGEPAINCLPGWKVLRQQPPGNAAANGRSVRS